MPPKQAAAAPHRPPPPALKEWAADLASAVNARQGGGVAALLSAPPLVEALDGWQPASAEHLLAVLQGHSLSEVALYEVSAAWAPTASKALRFLLCGFDAFLQIHTAERKAPPVGWDTAILVTMVHRIRECASVKGAIDADGDRADDAVNDTDNDGGGGGDVIGVLVRTWRKGFLTVRGLDPDYSNNESRRRGALSVLNGLLGILFLHRNIHQARIIIQSVMQMENEAAAEPGSGGGVIGPCGHMTSEVVRFLYYRGRVSLYDRDLPAAFSAFQEACGRLPPFDKCTEKVRRNRLRLVFYWSVAGLCCGAVPPEALLGADPLLKALVGAFTTAIGNGSDVAFDAALEYYAPTLKLRGVYALMLAAARPLCLLVRLMRVHAAIGSTTGGDASRVPLELLLSAEQQVIDAAAVPQEQTATGTSSAGGAKRGRQGDAAAPNNQRQAGTDDAECLCAAERSVLDGASYVPRHRAERQELRAAVRRTIDPVDELGLRVAQLIGSGRVMGYVATDAQTLVLSKKNPFPRPPVSTEGYALPSAS